MPKKKREVPSWLGATLVAGAFAGLWLWERRRPLRRSVEPKLERGARNLTVAGLAAAAVQFVERPIIAPLAALVEERKWGLLKRLALPEWLEVVLAVVLLDYTLYVWHVLTHRVPLLWRFHLAHHVDLDLDATTALRFHFGEITLSTAWRAAQVLLIGAGPLSLSVWQTWLLVSVLFHHSNVRLPLGVERRLCLLLVTPRMHGIHHSAVREETNSNWSSGLALWDRLHSTLRLDVPQQAITIGVPAYRDPREVGLVEVLKLPFVRQRPTWLLHGDGEPSRAPLLQTQTDRPTAAVNKKHHTHEAARRATRDAAGSVTREEAGREASSDGGAPRPSLSIIIPTLDEARSIAATLDAVEAVRGFVEVIVADGGSTDGTLEIVKSRGVRVVECARGRGQQLRAGAAAARGDALWFLHADTTPPHDAAEQISAALDEADVAGGNFHVRFDGERKSARFLTWLYPRLRRLGLCYGDSGIFARRASYERVGGFNHFPIFEDLDLVRRLRRAGRVVHLPATVVTSSRRFEGRSFALTFARWSLLQTLYWLGVHPRRLARLYEKKG